MNKQAPTVSYERSKSALRAWLGGRGYYDALRAMKIAETYHTGTRKNGAPEFSHQVAQAHILYALEPHLQEKQLGFVAVFLHDTPEDYGTVQDAAPLPPFRLTDVRTHFGTRGEAVIDRLSKVIDGKKKDVSAYFEMLSEDPTASIVKGLDRIHNHQYMHGAFTAEKRDSYMDETEEHILPMLKRARKNFPDQLPAYELIKIMLHSQMGLIRAMEPVTHIDADIGGRHDHLKGPGS